MADINQDDDLAAALFSDGAGTLDRLGDGFDSDSSLEGAGNGDMSRSKSRRKKRQKSPRGGNLGRGKSRKKKRAVSPGGTGEESDESSRREAQSDRSEEKVDEKAKQAEAEKEKLIRILNDIDHTVEQDYYDPDDPDAPLRWEFDGEAGLWDICVVFDKADDALEAGVINESGANLLLLSQVQSSGTGLRARRGLMLHTMNLAGLMLRKHHGYDSQGVPIHYYLVSATHARLALQAEMMRFPMMLKESLGGGFTMPFSRVNEALFKRHSRAELFSPTERQRIILNIIEADHKHGGAALRPAFLQQTGVTAGFFPMHLPSAQADFSRRWSSFTALLKPQPIGDIRAYFGEEVALYFAWLGHYNTWLFALSVIGIACFAAEVTTGSPWASAAYALLSLVWAFAYRCHWYRYEYRLAVEWNTTDYTPTANARANYKGNPRRGVWFKGVFASFDGAFDDKIVEKPWVTVEMDAIVGSTRETTMYTAVVSAVTLFLACACAAIAILILALRYALQVSAGGIAGALVGAFIGSLITQVLNEAYIIVARRIVDWENRRTEDANERRLVANTFFFHFVNTFAALYFIGFAKDGFSWGSLASGTDRCFVTNAAERATAAGVESVGNGCMVETHIQLGVFMLVNMVLMQAYEALKPVVLQYIGRWRKQRQELRMHRTLMGESDPEAPPEEAFEDAEALRAKVRRRLDQREWEKQAKLVQYPGLLSEYSEMVLQFAMVLVFAAACPLAPALALINNFVEIRTDAVKYMRFRQKPFYKGARDIGRWHEMSDIVVLIAIPTNVALVALGYPALPSLVGTAMWTIVAAVVIDRFLYVINRLVQGYVDKTTPAASTLHARKEFLSHSAKAALEEDVYTFNFKPDLTVGARFTYAKTFLNGQAVSGRLVQLHNNAQAKSFVHFLRRGESQQLIADQQKLKEMRKKQQGGSRARLSTAQSDNMDSGSD